jgi:hypothetical protein
MQADTTWVVGMLAREQERAAHIRALPSTSDRALRRGLLPTHQPTSYIRFAAT